MTYGGSSYGGSSLASTSGPSPERDRSAVFRVTRDGSIIEDAVFDVDPVVDTANPFGDYVVVKMDDRGGQKFDKYARGTRVDVQIARSATSVIDLFTGYVVERRESEQSGADVLEVEAYSFDQFLRRNTVTNDQTGNTITQALADIIQTDTPVSYVAGNVTVGDNQTLTRGYQGVAVENVLRDLAFKSNNEDFGVNDSLEFFFRPRETTHIERGIDNTQWFNYDIPELGKEAINEVEVWFDDGEESVIVDDGTDKLDLQDSLGLPSPGTQRAELNRPLITDIGDAEDIGRKYLVFKNSTLSGTVTTYGLFEAEPGDTIDIQIDARGIDAEFVVAACEYRWGVDQTILTIVEKRGDVDDIISELSDSVQRVEMNGANRDAPKNRITTTNATGIISVTANADGNTPDADRFVNDGRRYVRDAWTGKSYAAISNLVVGSDGSGLSRSNDALRNQTNSAAVSQSLPDATSVTFDATITQTGVEEIGLEDGNGNLIMRATFDTPVDLDGTVTVTLDVSNDASVSRGVLTDAGQTAVRDVLASNTPALPNQYAYGSDGTAVSESDTALGNELVSVSLEEILIQTANSQSQWEGLLGTIASDEPLAVDTTGPKVLQSAFTVEGQDSDGSVNSTVRTNGVYSDGIAAVFGNAGDRRTWTFTTEYDISEFEVAIRWASNDTDFDPPEGEWRLDGSVISGFSPSTSPADDPLWEQTIISRSSIGADPGTVEAGQHELVFEVTQSGTTGFVVDVVAPYDTGDRFGGFSYTFDNSNGGSGGYLDGPQFFPSVLERSLTTADTRRNVTEANFSLTANDVSNNFYVELANDGSTFTRINNSQTGSVTFAGAERGVDVNIGLGRYGTRSSATPQTGFNAQQIDEWNLFGNPDSVVSDNIGQTETRGVVTPNTIDGSTVREAGLKSNGTLLTRHEVAEFDVLADQRLASSEITKFSSDN